MVNSGFDPSAVKPLQIELQCPECGAGLIWLEQQRLKRCDFCSSTLYFEQNQEHRFHIEPRVKTAEEIKQVLVLSKAEKKRAAVAANAPKGNPDQPNMITIGFLPLTPYLEEFERKISITESRLLFVPYWHFRATLYQCLLATDEHDNKEYLLRRSPVDEAVAAYDGTLWNFRDRGLRFGESRLKEATREFLASQTHIAFSVDAESHLERYLRIHSPAEEQTSYLFKLHALCGCQKLPVFRPYWLVRFLCDVTESVLVDASYGTIAGYPSWEEFTRFLSYSEKPYAGAQLPKIQVISSRCPVCGADSDWAPEERIHFCANCGRALALNAGQIETIRYHYSSGSDHNCIYLPCWEFPVTVLYQNRAYHSLHDFYKIFFQERLLKSASYSGSLRIPAVRIKRLKKGDQLFSALLAHASSTNYELTEGPAQLEAHVQPCECDIVSASELLSLILPTASGIPPALHRSGELVEMLKNTKLDFGTATLKLIAYPVQGSQLIVGKQRFPLHLLDAE